MVRGGKIILNLALDGVLGKRWLVCEETGKSLTMMRITEDGVQSLVLILSEQ